MQNDVAQLAATIIVGSSVVLILCAFLIAFLFFYQKKKYAHLQEKAKFAEEILKSQVEVQNSTLQQIGQELHDNIGQLLSVAKINLNILEETEQKEENCHYIRQTNEIIGQSINDLRSLTKSLDGNIVQQFGLQESISHELQRIRKTRKFQTEITVTGDVYSLGYDREIILFRITQEILNNSIKHSGAKNIHVRMIYASDKFSIYLHDDGKGFDPEAVLKRKLADSGSGVRNIQRRTEMIGGSCNLETAPGKGTKIEIELPNQIMATDSSQA
jgi:two-component system NarL family sensor kinase